LGVMSTPHLDSLDHATLSHLCAWLDWATDDTDRLSTQAAIEAGLATYPDAIDRGLTWREIAERGR
jgi:hypothetical protein